MTQPPPYQGPVSPGTGQIPPVPPPVFTGDVGPLNQPPPGGPLPPGGPPPPPGMPPQPMPPQVPKKSGSGVLIGVVIGIVALMLLCGGGAVVWFFVLDGSGSSDAEVLRYHDAVDSCEEFSDTEYTGPYTEVFGTGPHLRNDSHNSGNDTSTLECSFTSNDPDEDLYLDSMQLEVATKDSTGRAVDWIESRREFHEGEVADPRDDSIHAVLEDLDEPGQDAFYTADLLDSGRWTVYLHVQDANLNITLFVQSEHPTLTEENIVDMLTEIATSVMPVMKR